MCDIVPQTQLQRDDDGDEFINISSSSTSSESFRVRDGACPSNTSYGSIRSEGGSDAEDVCLPRRMLLASLSSSLAVVRFGTIIVVSPFDRLLG